MIHFDIQMVFLRNYSVDFLRDGHNQQPHAYRKGLFSNFSHLVLRIKVRTLPLIEFFLISLTFVDIESHISL